MRPLGADAGLPAQVLAGLDAPRRIEIEQPLVDAAELLDAEIAVRDALGPPRASPRRQRQQRLPHRAIVERHAVGERRVGGREQTAVERRHAQRADAAAAMRQPRDRLQRLPHAHAAAAASRPVPAATRWCSRRGRSDATAAPGRGPRRRAGTGSGRRRPALRRTLRPDWRLTRPRRAGRCPASPAAAENARVRCPARRGPRAAATLEPTRDAARSARWRVRAAVAASRDAPAIAAPRSSPQKTANVRSFVDRGLEVELDEPARVGPRRCRRCGARPGQAETPALALPDAETDGVAPRGRRMLSPARDEQRRRAVCPTPRAPLESSSGRRVGQARRGSRARSAAVPPAGRRWRAAPAPGQALAQRHVPRAKTPPRRLASASSSSPLKCRGARSARGPLRQERAGQPGIIDRAWNEECGDELESGSPAASRP